MQPAPPPIVAPAPSPSPAAAPWIAAPRPWNTEPWLAQHDAFVARANAGGIDAVFIGDSIAEFFATRASAVWDARIAPLGTVADFGISGDRTQFVLWRVQHGELDRSGARAVVVMAGTNNLAAATPDAVARGIAAIVDAVRARLPHAVVVLNAILPRGSSADPLRAKAAAVNARIATLADGDRVRWVDASAGFVDANGELLPGVMPDGLHPSPAGYEVWASALRPVLLDALSK